MSPAWPALDRRAARTARLSTTTAGRLVFLALSVSLALGTAAGSGAQKLQVETFSLDRGLPSASIYSLSQDADGRLWLAGRGGIVVYDGRDFETYSARHGLTREIGAVAADRARRIWAASRWGAVRLYVLDRRDPETGWRTASAQDSPGTDGVTALLVRPDDAGRATVYVGAISAGLLRWTPAGWKRFPVPAPGKNVTALATLAGVLYVGTDAGLCTLGPSGVDCSIQTRDPRLRTPLRALGTAAEDDGPERLWILAEDWLGRLDADGTLVVEADDLGLRNFVLTLPGALAVDHAGGVYFGTPSVSFFFDPFTRRVSRLGRDEGLVADGSTSILIDREGSAWIAGLRGLSRIGSQRFLSFDQGQGLLEDEVSAIAESARGDIVFGHNSGLTLLRDGGPTTIPLPRPPDAPISLYRVLDIHADGDGTLWIAAYERGLLRLEEDLVPRSQGLVPPVLSVERDTAGRLWAVSGPRSDLVVDDGGGFRRVEHGLGDSGGFVRWLTASDDGRLFVATRRGLLWRDAEGSWRYTTGPTEPASNLYGALPRPEGTVWIGAAAGLYRLDGERLAPLAPPLRVTRPVYFLREDPRGRVWLGTDDGVLVWDGEDLRQLTVRHGLAGRETNRGAALVDRRGRVWIGTESGASLYQAPYDKGPARPPNVLLGDLEIAGRTHPPATPLELAHHENALTFHVETIAYSREEPVRYRYRLEGLDTRWIETGEIADGGVRYPNVPPGRYRFSVAARFGDGPWSAEAVSGGITIARPWWRRPVFLVSSVLLLAGSLFFGHRLRTAMFRIRNRELETINARLEQTLDERARVEAERERLIAELETKNAELERFTYTVSHDLKSPLVTIRGFLGFLEKDARAGDVKRLERDLELIRNAAEKMSRLLDELLQLSRIGRVISPPEDVPFGELAAEALDLLAGQLAARGVEVTVDPDSPAVRGDRRRLREVLQNLIDNAIKFMGDERAPRIEVGARRDGDRVRCHVHDNGVGIDPEYLEKIFDLFERLDPDTDGTGVGLALVRRIVEVHGGRIWAESEGRGHGATFYFTLPAAGADDDG